jgi:predicted negative regulator of RcsB-dependent stress response
MLLNVHHGCDENANSDLLDDASERLKMWRGTATSQDSRMKAILETELGVVLTEAKANVDSAVANQIPKGKVRSIWDIT